MTAPASEPASAPVSTVRYPVTPQHPPLGVVVWVVWDHRPPFLAARVAHPETRREAWLVKDGGRAVLLPCREAPREAARPWAGWHTLRGQQPDCWSPQSPERWASPLPPPLHQGPAAGAGRLWSSTMRFAAVEEAEASELAQEMHRDRELARSAEGPAEGEAEPPEKQWWLDPHLVAYSRPGEIGLREAEGRLMRAFLTEWWIRIERPSDRTFGTILAGLAMGNPMTAAELAAEDPRPFRAEPNGRDRDDMLVALGWLKAFPRIVLDGRPPIAGAAETILRLRGGTPPRTWRSIGRSLGHSHEAARKEYARAIGVVTVAANGGATTGGAFVAESLATLQTANRRHQSKDTSTLVDRALAAMPDQVLPDE
jgi:hypothetical protein